MTSEKTDLSVLIVEDDVVDRESIMRKLESLNTFNLFFYQASSVAEASQILQSHSIEFIFLDYNLPGETGFCLLEDLNHSGVPIPVILLAGEINDYVAAAGISRGAHEYLRKDDLTEDRLLIAIASAMAKSELQKTLIKQEKDLHNALHEAERSRTEALEAQRTKSIFLSNMSHEIRTPLTSIIGFAEALQSNLLNAKEVASAHATILSNGRHLLQLINDILDFSKIEAGEFKVVKSEFRLIELLRELHSTFEPQARGKGLNFHITLGSDIPESLYSSQIRIRQILYNLIGNAIKFTMSGEVTLQIEYESGASELSFSVKDTGIGIPKDKQHKLFQAFSQVNQSTAREHGGTGLGLVISAQLATLLSGNISYSSQEGEGSLFTLTLPGIEAKEYLTDLSSLRESQSSDQAFPLPKFEGTVVLAEDCQDSQKLVLMLLSRLGLKAYGAPNGKVALEQVRKHKPDLVLLDMQMPIMDGYETARILHEEFPDLPLVALTASVLETAQENCFQAGCIAYLKKPFLQRELCDVLSNYLPMSVDEKPAPKDQSEEPKNHLGLPEFDTILTGYIERLPERIQEIKVARENQDLEQVRKLTHKLAGAKLFGLTELGELASLVEGLIYEQESQLVEIDSNLDTLYKLALALQEKYHAIPSKANNEKMLYLVSSNAAHRAIVRKICEKEHITVQELSSANQVVEDTNGKGILLLDLELPMTLEIIEAISETSSKIPVIGMSTEPSHISLDSLAAIETIESIIQKPVQKGELEKVLARYYSEEVSPCQRK